MAPSVLLYTILFTLDHVPCHKNKYIDVFLIWLSCLVKSNSLNENDMLLIIMDKHTKQYLERDTICNKLISTYHFHIMPTPKTLLEGCMWKYNALTEGLLTHYNKDILFYLDIDVIFNKSFKPITDNMIPENIYVQQKGSFDLRYYSDGIPPEEKDEFIKCIPTIKGISAGKFIIYGISLAVDFFNRIIEYNKVKTNYESLEQPFFNRAIYNFLCIEKKVQILYCINDNIIYWSQMDNKPSAIMIDFCGNTGDGSEHLDKIQGVFCLLYINSK